MALDTYSSLQTSLANWLNRQDLTALIPDFITLAEADFNDRLRVQAMVKTATTTLGADSYPLPADWLEAHTIKATSNPNDPRLKYAAPDELHEVRAYNSETYPTHYSMWGGNLEFAPVHGQATVSLAYYAKIPALSGGNPTNWLLAKRPDAYLYGALRHAAPYLMEDERVQLWQAAYEAAITALSAADESARFSGAPLARRVKSFG